MNKYYASLGTQDRFRIRLPTIIGKLADISSVSRFEKYHCTCTQHINVKATYYVFESLIKKKKRSYINMKKIQQKLFF